MMHDAIASVEGKLNESGFGKDSQAYADLRAELMQAELRQIKMFAQLAVAASAETLRFDLSAAMFAANNALENNFSQVFLSLYAFGKAKADEVDDEADQQAYGKARKKAIDAVTPELVKKYGAKIADYAGNVIFGPDGYADEMIKVIRETTGLNDVSPEIRQMLKEAANTALKGVGVALDAPGEGTEYILLKAGVDRATARNVHRAINDFMMVAGAAGLAKSATQFGARTASSSSKAGTRTSLDGLGLEGRTGKSTKPVRDMSDREYVQSLADRADKRFDGKGSRVGTQKHKYAEQVHKRYQRMTGERRHMEAEKRFSEGRPWEEGQGVKGSSRADMYNRRANEAYDYKFGDAKLSSGQRQKYEANLPRNGNDSAKVHETKPTSSRS
ncbi:MAG: hypothetical protein KF798_06615 [Candidatus Paracaedibacteraceae bacterium]|nr:hypothetical protein [Candidatus Paracaedibacteraceae bacterium]